MWELKDKYKSCCHNDSCDSFDTCIECWDEWAERNPPMTNADRIRAMSDEELARFIESIGEYVAKGTYCTELLNVKDFPYSCMDNKECCVKHACEWLKQPAEEEL